MVVAARATLRRRGRARVADSPGISLARARPLRAYARRNPSAAFAVRPLEAEARRSPRHMDIFYLYVCLMIVEG
jgi:hypothetical protein